MGRKHWAAYVVTVGTQTGVFDTWNEAGPKVYGVPRSIYKGYTSKAEAKRVYRLALAKGLVKVVPGVEDDGETVYEDDSDDDDDDGPRPVPRKPKQATNPSPAHTPATPPATPPRSTRSCLSPAASSSSGLAPPPTNVTQIVGGFSRLSVSGNSAPSSSPASLSSDQLRRLNLYNDWRSPKHEPGPSVRVPPSRAGRTNQHTPRASPAPSTSSSPPTGVTQIEPPLSSPASSCHASQVSSSPASLRFESIGDRLSAVSRSSRRSHADAQVQTAPISSKLSSKSSSKSTPKSRSPSSASRAAGRGNAPTTDYCHCNPALCARCHKPLPPRTPRHDDSPPYEPAPFDLSASALGLSFTQPTSLNGAIIAENDPRSPVTNRRIIRLSPQVPVAGRLSPLRSADGRISGIYGL